MTTDSTMGRLVSIIHTISCQKEHSSEMESLTREYEEDKCYFYLEEAVIGGEDMPDHRYWKAQVESLCNHLGLSPEEVLGMIPTLLNTRRVLDGILQKHPSAGGFVRLVLFDEPL